MIYELRSYDIDPRLLDDYLAWANDRALPILVGRFGFRLVGFWYAVAPTQPDAGPVPPTNVHWIIAWTGEDEMSAQWAAARSSKEWQAINEGRPKYHLKVQATLLHAIPRSPFQ